MGARYVPNTIPTVAPAPTPSTSADHDLLFVGKLDYEPNIAAVTWLDEHWADFRRPDGSSPRLLVAGARPGDGIRAAAARHGWTLVPDFADEADVYSRAPVAVVPLPYATGIQNKVIDALRYGRTVIASPAAADGLPLDPPIEVTPLEQLPARCLAALDDPAGHAIPAARIAAWLEDNLSPAAHASVLRPDAPAP
jgi:hypothetical protein